MKNLKTTLLSLLLLVFAICSAQAHALWIHTASRANVGQAHEFTVYYADYHEGAVEKIDDWYSDVNSFQIFAVSPSGKRTPLTYQKGSDHVKGSFTPEEEGLYRLEIGHSSKTEAGGTLYQFNAVAYVQAGKKSKQAGFAQAPDLVLVPKKGNSYQVLLSGKPLADSDVVILAPSGETAELKTDAKGEFAAKLDEKGAYYIEATTYRELEKNDPSGLKAVWRCATQVVTL